MITDTLDLLARFFLVDILPGEVFFLIFGVEAVIAFVLGLHAWITARRLDPSLERDFALSLAQTMVFTVTVTNVVFSLAFFVGAAIFSGAGLILFLPGLIAIIRCLRAWMKLIAHVRLETARLEAARAE